MAIEGMGGRIRNKILNKNLSREQIRQAVRNIFKQKFSTLKINIIVKFKNIMPITGVGMRNV